VPDVRAPAFRSEAHRAEIGNHGVKPRSHLTVGVFGDVDTPRFGNAFQSRGDIDAIVHQIAIALLNDIADMNADAELDTAIWRHAHIALDHSVLDLDGTLHSVNHTTELNEKPRRRYV